MIFHARLGIIAKQLNTEGYSSGRRGVTRKRMTILEASLQIVLIFQGFRGIMQRKSSRFSLLLFSPFSLMFWEHQKHNLIRRCIEVVITAPTRKIRTQRSERPRTFPTAQEILRDRIFKTSYRSCVLSCFFPKQDIHMRYTEGYRSGHNENDSKSFDGQKPSVGSNPTPSATEKPSHIKAFSPYGWAFFFTICHCRT